MPTVGVFTQNIEAVVSFLHASSVCVHPSYVRTVCDNITLMLYCHIGYIVCCVCTVHTHIQYTCIYTHVVSIVHFAGSGSFETVLCITWWSVLQRCVSGKQ